MGQFLFQMLGEELGGAVPGELGALSIIVRTRFVAEGMPGVVPVRLEWYITVFQFGLERPGSLGRKRGVFFGKVKLKRHANGSNVAGLLRWITIPRRASVYFLDVKR